MPPDEKPDRSTDSGTVEPETIHDFGFVPIPRRLRYDPEIIFSFLLSAARKELRN
jgi:hypothetical protein